MQIDEFVIPIEERGIEAYESGWDKAVELGIFNEWTAKMREALGRLNTELYPPLHEIGFELRSHAPTPLPALITGLRRNADGRSVRFLLSEARAAAKAEDAKAEDAKAEDAKAEDAKAGAKP
jgi:hypothetical protein